jgi:hypothetical protein
MGPDVLQPGNAEDDYEEAIDDGSTKRMKFDDELEEIIAKIIDKYPAGLCANHPDITCFHHRPSDLHFELNHPCCLVWAAAIVSCKL